MASPSASLSKQEMQLKVVKEAALENDVVLEEVRYGGVLRSVHQQGVLLVRAEDVDDLAAHLDSDLVPGGGVDDDRVQLRKLDGETVVQAMTRLNGIHGLRPGIATPNHLVSICPLNMCPADEPVSLPSFPPPLPLPPVSSGNGGDGVRVDVLDTGLMDHAAEGHPWLADVPATGGTAKVEGFPNLGIGRAVITEYAGHGTFIASVLRSAAPRVAVFVENTLSFAGATMENLLGRSLLDRLTNHRPHIISLSAGGTTYADRRHLGLEPFFAKLTSADCTTLLVAAAGNDGGTQPFWPAAYAPERPDAVVSVGALRADLGGRACFSNYGSWVRVFAAGERFVHAFPSGGYTYVDPPSATCRNYPSAPLYAGCTCVTAPAQGSTVSFAGMARWSGTSFSTPLVAGRIARHMTDTGQQNPRLAAQHLLSTQTQTLIDHDGVPLTVLQ